MAELLDEYRLNEVADRPAANLNNAQQKMLDLVRALATRPRLLLLDELAAGLNPAELDWIAERIKALARSGIAIIVVEHLMGFIEHITDRVIVMNAGKEIFEGKLAVAVKVEAKGVDAGYGTMQVLWGVDLDVRAGETVLLLGANGAGKTTFLKSLVGLIEARHGSIQLAGEDVTRMRSSDRMRLGMTYMSELAVFPDLSIEENIRVGAQALGHADPGARVEELYGVFPALREKRRAPASSLSGGQRKMLGIAKALAAEPRLLVMDEPSAGLSPLFVKEVIRILSDLRGRGLALLIAEQNIGFLEVATRVFVLEGGRIRFSGTVAEMTDNEALRRAYFGLK
jgi:branched-chain amino acid transport system ATP-binding protein